VGNYSKNPQTAYQEAVQKGYARVRFQQGKPILDRELNLLSDLAGPQRLAPYMGNGVPDGSDGFRISGLSTSTHDFQIKAGRCLVNGYEVVLAADTTYKNQPHKERVGPLPTSTSGILPKLYLRVIIAEATEAQDAELQNPGDVGFETSVRERVEWEVFVSATDITAPDHFLLAQYFTSPTVMVTDRRITGMTLAKVRDDLNTSSASATSANTRLDLIMGSTQTIKDNIVTTTKILDGAVTSPKLFDGAVTSPKLGPNAVGPGQLADNAVLQQKLADNSVSATKIQPGVIGTQHLGTNIITFDRMGFVPFLNQQITIPANGTVVTMIHPISMTQTPRFIFHNVIAIGDSRIAWYEYFVLTARYMVVINQTGGTATVQLLSYWLP
jgi:hypothetical protein